MIYDSDNLELFIMKRYWDEDEEEYNAEDIEYLYLPNSDYLEFYNLLSLAKEIKNKQ